MYSVDPAEPARVEAVRHPPRPPRHDAGERRLRQRLALEVAEGAASGQVRADADRHREEERVWDERRLRVGVIRRPSEMGRQ